MIYGNTLLKNKNLYTDNIVPLIFIMFTLLGFAVATGVPLNFFLSELSSRFYRNAFLVLSLIIPVIAGIGLNFGIVVGAMSGQIAVVIVRYFFIEGFSGMLMCFILATPIAAFFGYLTGKLYNKTRGQEMIASLIVGFFANGIYQFLFLFVVGVIIPVAANHPMILTDGVGIRMTVDMGTLKYSLESIFEVPFIHAVLAVSASSLIYILLGRRSQKQIPLEGHRPIFIAKIIALALVIIISVIAIITDNSLMYVKKVPVFTVMLIVLLGIFTKTILKTKLGQDFRSVGQSQHIARSNGIDVDKTRIIAVIMSTVLAAWGQLIYLQNMGTLNTYGAHNQIGMFSVAALLVGGASVSKAKVSQAIAGTLLFNSMFIMSPEIGKALFGQAILGEYFRTFMVYGVIGLALGLYVWNANRKARVNVEG